MCSPPSVPMLSVPMASMSLCSVCPHAQCVPMSSVPMLSVSPCPECPHAHTVPMSSVPTPITPCCPHHQGAPRPTQHPQCPQGGFLSPGRGQEEPAVISPRQPRPPRRWLLTVTVVVTSVVPSRVPPPLPVALGPPDTPWREPLSPRCSAVRGRQGAQAPTGRGQGGGGAEWGRSH